MVRGLRPQRTEDGLDEQAFERVFRESAADVHGYAISLLRDRAAAEDVTALAFERLFRSRGKLDSRRGSARALLFAIARNAALDELRRRQRRPHRSADELDTADERAMLEFERVEQRATVSGALLDLPLRDRELVLLKFHGQLTNAQLARALGVSESNAGTRLHRALLRLRENCEQLGREEIA